ncbi:MAG: hypothetical protein V7K47_07610 [Nostoc sp.]
MKKPDIIRIESVSNLKKTTMRTEMRTDIKVKTTNLQEGEIIMNPLPEQLNNEEFLDGELSEEDLNIIAAGLSGNVDLKISGSGGVDAKLGLHR